MRVIPKILGSTIRTSDRTFYRSTQYFHKRRGEAIVTQAPRALVRARAPRWRNKNHRVVTEEIARRNTANRTDERFNFRGLIEPQAVIDAVSPRAPDSDRREGYANASDRVRVELTEKRSHSSIRKKSRWCLTVSWNETRESRGARSTTGGFRSFVVMTRREMASD